MLACLRSQRSEFNPSSGQISMNTINQLFTIYQGVHVTYFIAVCDWKTCFNTQKDYFNQGSAYEAPVFRSKCTTFKTGLKQFLKSNIFGPFTNFSCPSNGTRPGSREMLGWWIEWKELKMAVYDSVFHNWWTGIKGLDPNNGLVIVSSFVLCEWHTFDVL